MDDAATPKKSWVLTQAAFDQLLAWLDPDRERAGIKYEEVRRRLLKFFECRGCAFPDEYTDETINRVARKVSEGEQILTSDHSRYFYGVARFVVLEYWKAPESKQVELDDMLPLAPANPDGPNQQLRCLEQCQDRLSAENRELIMQYYVGEKRVKIDNRNRLAGQRGLSLNALRIQACRIKAGLEKCIDYCLKR
jgi:DNA-directed RNA polymerase specialized sigma24 family protein